MKIINLCNCVNITEEKLVKVFVMVIDGLKVDLSKAAVKPQGRSLGLSITCLGNEIKDNSERVKC